MKNKLIIRRMLAAALSVSMLGNALQLHAEETTLIDVCCNEGTVVAFFNGVLNTRLQAAHTRDLLKKIHGDTSPNGRPIQYWVMYNHTNGFEDFVETFNQRMSEQNAILANRYELFFATLGGSSDGTLWTAIKKAFGGPTLELPKTLIDTFNAGIVAKLLSLFRTPPTAIDYAEHRSLIDQFIAGGNKILFVAHSQGNLFSVPAYDYAISKTKQSAVRVVHIAPASPALRGPHILADLDVVINGLRPFGNVASATDQIPPYLQRPADEDGHTDVLGHGMSEIYINQQLGISKTVKNAINTALAEMIAPG